MRVTKLPSSAGHESHAQQAAAPSPNDVPMLSWENEGGMIPPFVILRHEERAKVSAILRSADFKKKP